MIYHSGSETSSLMPTNSDPISSGFILQLRIRPHIHYKLYWSSCVLHFFVSILMYLSGCIDIGNLFCSGSFQSSPRKEPLSEYIRIFLLSFTPETSLSSFFSGSFFVHFACRFHYQELQACHVLWDTPVQTGVPA